MALRYKYLIADGSLIHNGIPARDLTDEDVAELSDEQRKTVAASPLYERVDTGKQQTAAKTVAAEGDGE